MVHLEQLSTTSSQEKRPKLKGRWLGSHHSCWVALAYNGEVAAAFYRQNESTPGLQHVCCQALFFRPKIIIASSRSLLRSLMLTVKKDLSLRKFSRRRAPDKEGCFSSNGKHISSRPGKRRRTSSTKQCFWSFPYRKNSRDVDLG